MLRRLLSSIVFCLPFMNVNLFQVHVAWLDYRWNGATAGIVANVWARTSINVKQFGAVGDGVHNDTAAISAAITAAGDDDMVLFPAGVYICNDVDVINKSNLTLKGQKSATVIRNGIPNGANPLLTFVGVTGLVIQDLVFDNRSIGSYGGVRFYDTENVLITRTRFFDSAPLPLGSTDRYAYVFGNGSRPHKNIKITSNLIEDLQLEVDFGLGVTIQRNTLNRSVRTAAIGLFTVDDNVELQDYLIDRNTIIDPVGAAIALNIDPSDNINVTFRNITITNNTIVFNHIPTEAIHAGPGNNSTFATGNVYENIVIQKNLIHIAAGAADQPDEAALIKFNAGPNSGLSFKHVTVTQNWLEGGGNPAFAVVAMNLRFLEDSTVSANMVYNMITVLAFNWLLNTDVRDNHVAQMEDYWVYEIDNSRGGNLFQNNFYSGPVSTALKNINGSPSDVIFQPTFANKKLKLRYRN